MIPITLLQHIPRQWEIYVNLLSVRWFEPLQSLNRVLYYQVAVTGNAEEEKCVKSLQTSLKLSYCTAKTSSFLPEGKKKKAYVLVGSLGCSKCKENTSAGLPLFYLFATSCSNMFDFRRDSYWTIVCWDLFVLDFSCFLLGYSSLAPLMGWL